MSTPIDPRPPAPTRTRLRRRPALIGLAAATVSAAGMTPHAAARDRADIAAQLVERAEQKNAAFMNGQMDRWLELARIDPDFTLMQPFGGPASQGFDASPDRLRRLARDFPRGTTSLEVARVYPGADLAVLVMIERQRAVVGGLPEQDWSLRVTEVYRRSGDDWTLVHRHADPLVRRRSLAHTAALARGAVHG